MFNNAGHQRFGFNVSFGEENAADKRKNNRQPVVEDDVPKCKHGRTGQNNGTVALKQFPVTVNKESTERYVLRNDREKRVGHE